MNKTFFILTFLLISSPVFATCPIEGDGSACIAEFQTFQPQTPAQIQPIQTPSALGSRNFNEIPGNVTNINQTENNQSTRNFGPKNSDYSYNASCQFGNCGVNGTPKNISAED